MNQYDKTHLSLLRTIRSEGEHKKDRTSVGGNTSYFGYSYHIDIDEVDGYYTMPFLQQRKFAPRIAFWELMWMLNGYTDSTYLEDKNIFIWSGNTTREFLDKRGLHHLPEKSIGKGYGYQMRNFNDVDQLSKVFDNLKNNPDDRRHIISLWNPADLDQMVLPPCHLYYNFSVTNGKLNLHQQQRSGDSVFGVPYNDAFTAIWLVVFAKALKYKPGKIFHTITDAHVYDNQLEIVDHMLDNHAEVDTVPKIKIKKELNSLDDILALDWSDIEVSDFTKGPSIGNAEMAQ